MVLEFDKLLLVFSELKIMFTPLSEYIELKLETAFYNKYHMLTYEESELWESYKEEFAEYLVGAFGDTTPKWDM